MQCNIDARGKAVRLVWGIINLVVGAVFVGLFFSGVLAGSWAWIVGVAAILGGAFAIFEARAGWCVVRAMGFKTPV
jgi:hypothetical protein